MLHQTYCLHSIPLSALELHLNGVLWFVVFLSGFVGESPVGLCFEDEVEQGTAQCLSESQVTVHSIQPPWEVLGAGAEFGSRLAQGVGTCQRLLLPLWWGTTVRPGLPLVAQLQPPPMVSTWAKSKPITCNLPGKAGPFLTWGLAGSRGDSCFERPGPGGKGPHLPSASPLVHAWLCPSAVGAGQPWGRWSTA